MADRASLLALQLSCRGNAARERVLRDLVSFAESRGELQQLQALPTTPRGATIDWLRLYEEVVARGGYDVVSRRKLWSEIASKSCMSIEIMPFALARHYERYLYAFEAKQVFGRDVPPSIVPAKRSATDAPDSADDQRIATANELLEAQNMGGTPLPAAPKRLKVQRSGTVVVNPDLGTLHSLVLALDSNVPRDVLQAINVLSVLSYGTPTAAAAAATAATPSDGAESELLLDGVPGLLDALYRQLQACELLPHEVAQSDLTDASATHRARRRLLHTNTSTTSGSDRAREVLDARGLLVLNVVRNLSMVAANEKLLADHEELVVYLILLLQSSHVNASWSPLFDQYERTPARAMELADHALDILCNVSKRIDFVALHPPAQLERWHVAHHLAARLWHKQQLLPLECLLQEIAHLLLQPAPLQRSILLRACELFCNISRDPSVRHLLAQSGTLNDPKLLHRVVGLLACTRDDSASSSSSRKQQTAVARSATGGLRVVDDAAMDDDDAHDGDQDDDVDDEQSKWPAPWESDGYPSGVGMGVVYVSPEGTRSVGVHGASGSDSAMKVDHEVRDAVLEVLFRLADVSDDAKLRIAKHPTCLYRVASVLTSCIGRPEAARIAVAILSSVSMNRQTFPFFLPIERDLVLVACSDRSVADILTNVVADVYGMHSL